MATLNYFNWLYIVPTWLPYINFDSLPYINFDSLCTNIRVSYGFAIYYKITLMSFKSEENFQEIKNLKH
jgi:hypothetical protein